MTSELTRAEVDAMTEPLVLEFGATWCEICKGAEPLIHDARLAHPEVKFLWVEDGRGKRLGRSFGVKLWPTLIFMRDGAELTRVVRPQAAADLAAAYARFA